MLERLAQTGTGRMPSNQVSVVIEIPDDLKIEHAPLDHTSAPLLLRESRAVGDRWLAGRRSAVLTVPSVVAPHDRNVVINPAHPEFVRIACSDPEPVVWDPRLFSRGEG